MDYQTNNLVELKKADLDKIICDCNSHSISWKKVLGQHLGQIDHDAIVQSVDRRGYDLVNYTLSELDDVSDVFYDGVMHWTFIHEKQNQNLGEIAEISGKLKTSEELSMEERNLIFDFLDPYRKSLTSMPHTWLWIILGGGRENKFFYFDEERGVYRVPSNHVRNILMYEMGAFFQMEAHLGREEAIQGRLAEMYPDDEILKDPSLWVQYMQDPDNSISGKMYRKHDIHKWLWETYHTLLVNRLVNPKASFESFISTKNKETIKE